MNSVIGTFHEVPVNEIPVQANFVAAIFIHMDNCLPISVCELDANVLWTIVPSPLPATSLICGGVTANLLKTPVQLYLHQT